MIWHRTAAAGAVVAMALVAAACGKTNESSGGGDGGGGAKVLRMGASLSLTGSLSREGVLTKQGYELCQDVVNEKGGVPIGGDNYKVKISYADDKSEPDTSSQLIDRFNDKSVKLILGPYGSAATEAAAAVVERNGQVMADSSGADDKIFDKGYQRTFAVLSPATKYAAAIVQAIAEDAKPKPKTVAFLSADDGFSKTVTEGGKAEAERQGMQVVATEYFPEHATDVSSSLTKVRGKNPDLVIGSVHLEEGIAIIKQSKELGVKPDGFGETVAPPTPDFRSTLRGSADGVLGSSQWVPQVEGSDKWFGSAGDYVKSFEQRYDDTPEYHNAEASAACLAFVLAAEQAGSTEPDAIRDALAGLDEQTFFGAIKFDDTGKNMTKPMAVIQIQSGKVATVWPASAAQAKLAWPATD